jgi:hypothetical protein
VHQVERRLEGNGGANVHGGSPGRAWTLQRTRGGAGMQWAHLDPYNLPPREQTGRRRVITDSANEGLAAAEGTPSHMSGRGDNVVRLGCAEQAAIADELRRYWQHVVDEGVPEHLRGLVQRFAEGADRQGAAAGTAAAQPARDATESAIILLADFRRGECESPP